MTESVHHRARPSRALRKRPLAQINGELVRAISVAAALPPEMYEAVKELAAKKKTNIQSVVCEGLNEIFKKENLGTFEIVRGKCPGRPRKKPALS